MMSGLYLNRRFFIGWLGAIFALVAAYIYPALLPWVAWLIGAYGILILVDAVLLFGFGKRFEARRNVTDKFSNGEDNPVRIEVDNRYPFKVKARILDESPVEFQRREPGVVLAMPAGKHREIKYNLHPVKRGEYRFGKIRVFVSSRLAFLERRYSFGEQQAVAVYPSFVAMHKAELLALAGKQIGENRQVRVASISTTFDQIKPYVPGDDPRTVNWKATAKCNRLMVNSYMEERSQQVYCLVDKGRTMQSPFHGMTVLDYAINATLALSNIILKKGDRAGLFTFSNKVGTSVKAELRSTQLGRICEALYKQRTNYLESDFEQLCLRVMQQVPTRSLLILFTNFDTVSGMKRRLPALLRLARTHLLLVVLFEDSEVKQIVEESAVSVKDIYFKTLAGSFLLEKKRIAGELRKAGIYVLLTQPEQLAPDAVNAYLGLKQRGLI